MSNSTISDELIRRAAAGELTGPEADAEAERLGIGRLSGEPDLALFDPNTARDWTLVMAVSWIAWRSKDAVRSVWDHFCANCWDWSGRPYFYSDEEEPKRYWFLVQRERPTLVELLMMSTEVNALETARLPQMTPQRAIEVLLLALREAAIVATGTGRMNERRVVIPPSEWLQLKPYQGHGEVDEVRYSASGTGYSDVLLPSNEVRKLWPLPKAGLDCCTVPVSPMGDGYMPLYCAARWIASDGGIKDFDQLYESVWKSAYDLLLAAIASGRVHVLGTRAGCREQVPAHIFADCCVDYPHQDTPIGLTMSEDIYLRSCPYLDEDRWRGGFNDTLVNRRGEHWSRLIVAKEDIRKLWPFSLVEALRTGTPGRPSSMHLILEELKSRGELGQLEATLRAQANVLVEWMKKTYPLFPRPTIKTTENQIRTVFNTLRLRTK